MDMYPKITTVPTEKGDPMARKTIFCCDRCGKEFKREGFTRFIRFPRKLFVFCWYDDRKCTETEFDLCQDCSSAFYLFMGNKEVKPHD